MVHKLVKNLVADEEARESKFYDEHPDLERPDDGVCGHRPSSTLLWASQL